MKIIEFLWIVSILCFVYALTSIQHNGFQLFYISELLNSEYDTLGVFLFRWFLWLQIPWILFASLATRLSPRWSWGYVVLWYFVVFSGFDTRLLGDEEMNIVLVYLHYVATSLLMLYSIVLLWVLKFRQSSIVWWVFSTAYLILFILYKTMSINFVPYFKLVELGFFVTVCGVILLT